MNILQLFVQLGIKGADKVESALGGVEEQAEHAAGGIRHAGESAHVAEAKFEHFEFAALEAVFALQQFVSAGKESIEVVTEFSGVAAASEWNHLSRSIQNVTGSAAAARDMLKELKEIGAGTGFNSQDLAKIAPELVNAGVAPGDVPEQIKSMTNMAAMGNLTRDQLPDFLETRVRSRDMDHPMVKQLTGMTGMPIKDLVNAGAGTHFKTANQADDFLAAVGGARSVKILLAGADALGKDAAALQKANDPAMALAKTLEILPRTQLSFLISHTILLPTQNVPTHFDSASDTWNQRTTCSNTTHGIMWCPTLSTKNTAGSSTKDRKVLQSRSMTSLASTRPRRSGGICFTKKRLPPSSRIESGFFKSFLY